VTVIKRILRTEKAALSAEKERKYAFEVNENSNKHQVKKAVADLYNVKVMNVNILNVPGKAKLVRYDRGYKRDWKKAIVTLEEGQKIDLTT
jgi:large subunit ribosomal protein L23